MAGRGMPGGRGMPEAEEAGVPEGAPVPMGARVREDCREAGPPPGPKGIPAPGR